jgi:hypothetical protein
MISCLQLQGRQWRKRDQFEVVQLNLYKVLDTYNQGKVHKMERRIHTSR